MNSNHFYGYSNNSNHYPIRDLDDDDADTVRYLSSEEYENKQKKIYSDQQNEMYKNLMQSAYPYDDITHNPNIQSPDLDRYLSNNFGTPMVQEKPMVSAFRLPIRKPNPIIRELKPINLDKIKEYTAQLEREAKEKAIAEKEEAGVRNLMRDFEGGKQKRAKLYRESKKQRKSRKQRKSKKTRK